MRPTPHPSRPKRAPWPARVIGAAASLQACRCGPVSGSSLPWTPQGSAQCPSLTRPRHGRGCSRTPASPGPAPQSHHHVPSCPSCALTVTCSLLSSWLPPRCPPVALLRLYDLALNLSAPSAEACGNPQYPRNSTKDNISAIRSLCQRCVAILLQEAEHSFLQANPKVCSECGF